MPTKKQQNDLAIATVGVSFLSSCCMKFIKIVIIKAFIETDDEGYPVLDQQCGDPLAVVMHEQ